MAPPPSPCPLPYLMPELIGEILVRFPPDDPACLVRASLVCKLWRRHLCDPAFRRRYAAFHRAPPLIGFLHNWYPNSYQHVARPRFVSTTTRPTPSPLPLQVFNNFTYGWHILDCRHGRVLFKAPDLDRHGRVLDLRTTNLVVWDHATGKKKKLPLPPFPRRMDYTAAVLCAVRGCDHVDCHSGPFLVVFVGFDINACCGLQSHLHLYSSEANTWSSSADPGPRFLTVRKPSMLIGDDLYFPLVLPSIAILKVDLRKNHLSIINRPGPKEQDFDNGNAVLVAAEDGSLGFAAILGSRVCLWSRNIVNSEVDRGWAQCRVIELQNKIPFEHSLRVVGSKEGSSIIFVASYAGVFSLDLNSASSHGTKVDEPREFFAIFPFMRFYTPDGARCKLLLPMGPH